MSNSASIAESLMLSGIFNSESLPPSVNRVSIGSVEKESTCTNPFGFKYTEGKGKVSDDEEEEYDAYWLEDGWVPTMKSGIQRTPNQIRNELQRYLDENSGYVTQRSVLEKLRVNGNSFRKFMNPGTYKDQWSAVQNGTYWAAARFLEEQRYRNEKVKEGNNSDSKKRKAASTTCTSNVEVTTPGNIIANNDSATNSNKKAKLDAFALVSLITSDTSPEVNSKVIYDSCPELVKKIKSFLQSEPGMNKSLLCQALELQANQLNRFLACKQQDAAGTLTYQKAWTFFEKLRIIRNLPKSNNRQLNELNYPRGFDLVKQNDRRHVYIFAR
jgi:hypothetical protein